jgi:hypothetical protein
MPIPTSASTSAKVTALVETWPGSHVPLFSLCTVAM